MHIRRVWCGLMMSALVAGGAAHGETRGAAEAALPGSAKVADLPELANAIAKIGEGTGCSGWAAGR